MKKLSVNQMPVVTGRSSPLFALPIAVAMAPVSRLWLQQFASSVLLNNLIAGRTFIGVRQCHYSFEDVGDRRTLTG